MFAIEQIDVPLHALLKTHLGKLPERWRGYQDCFRVRMAQEVQLADFVVAFYTSPIFKLERLLLRAFLGIRSSDADADALLAGTRDTFAAWYEGARSPNQLLMCDRYEGTRSWFMVEAVLGGGTDLCFGSAVASRPDRRAMPSRFRRLLVFHVLYSKLLLTAAAWQLGKHASARRSRVPRDLGSR